MVEKYGVVFFWDDEYNGYVAEAVGLPGCFSQGKTMEDAIENIKDAIKGYLFVENQTRRRNSLKGIWKGSQIDDRLFDEAKKSLSRYE